MQGMFFITEKYPYQYKAKCHSKWWWLEICDADWWVDLITIVAIFTIVAINHNCRNTNHNCCNSNHDCNLDQPRMSLHQSQISQFFKSNYCLFHINFVSNFDIPSNFQQSLLYFSQLNYENCEILWHTIRLCHSCHNFDIEIVTVCEILEILATSQGKIATFVTTQFFDNEVDEIICGQWDCQQTDHR